MYQNEAEKAVDALRRHHNIAWREKNIESIMEEYDEDSFLIVNHEIFQGRERIRAAFISLFDLFNRGKFEVKETIKGNIYFISWAYDVIGDKEYHGTDTFIIENDKIKVQTVWSTFFETHILK